MNKKILVIFISVLLISVFAMSVSAYNYYDDEVPWYETGDFDLDYYYPKSGAPNLVIIEFNETAGYKVYTPDSNLYWTMSNEIETCIIFQMMDDDANVTTLKEEIKEICVDWGIENPEIKITTPYGDDCFFYIARGNGISMEPTLKHGQTMVFNKTRDVHVGDIVSAYYPLITTDHIVKRVAKIDGDNVFLVSDNVEGTYESNGQSFDYEGLRTWVKISDIDGVLIDAYYDENYEYSEYDPNSFEF